MWRGFPANTDIEAALDLLYGPLYHRLLHGHEPVNHRFVRQVVDAAPPDCRRHRPSPARLTRKPGRHIYTTTNGIGVAGTVASVE